jgi:hypothetical protein
MITLSKDQIKKIADFLDSGLKCYYNKITHEIKEILDFDSTGADTEGWEDLIEELDEHFENYVEFEKMSSHESFKVMVDFTNEVVDDETFRKRLIWALNRPHSYRNFKNEIDFQGGEYRQKWFKFKGEKYIEYVERQILELNEMAEFRANEEASEEQDGLEK